MKDYFLLSWKSLKRRGLRSWLTIIGIFIGVAAVVALISLGQALQNSVASQFGGLEPTKISVTNANSGFGPPGSSNIGPLTDKDVELIKKIYGVREVYGAYLEPVTVGYNKKESFTLALSIPPEKEEQDLFYKRYEGDLLEGNFLRENDNGKVILGYDFTQKETFDKEIRLGRSILINDEPYKVSGFLKKTGDFSQRKAIFILRDDLESLVGLNKEYDLIDVYVKEEALVDQITEEISKAFLEDRNEEKGKESFNIQNSKSTLQNINGILIMVNVIVIAIASVSLLIGGIGVANNMFTSILERRNEIGIMKAIGAKNNSILAVFLMEAGLLSLIGGLSGALFGISIALFMSYVASQFIGKGIFVVNFSIWLILGSALFSFVVGLIAGYIPAKKASKLNPVDAIRK